MIIKIKIISDWCSEQLEIEILANQIAAGLESSHFVVRLEAFVGNKFQSLSPNRLAA